MWWSWRSRSARWVAAERPSSRGQLHGGVLTSAATLLAAVLVAGGGGVAMDLVKKISAEGGWVLAFQRSNTRQAAIESK